MPGPLHGVRILDLTTMMSGPLATMLLADQGAEVIKIETPTGELMRKVGGTRHGLSDSFQCSNRGKRSLSIDIKSAAGLQVVKKLVATADVLLENFRPGAVERMGLGEDVARGLRPDIIFVSVNGVGESGPYADMRTYDPMIQALSGLAEIQADKDTGRPRMVRTVICDDHRIDRGPGRHRRVVRASTKRKGPARARFNAGRDGGLPLARGHGAAYLRGPGTRSRERPAWW